jgi:hypothetical protein
VQREDDCPERKLLLSEADSDIKGDFAQKDYKIDLTALGNIARSDFRQPLFLCIWVLMIEGK